LGKPEDNLIRMILRRGIPYGEAIIGKPKITQANINKDRSLIFLCYKTSIEDQFEFLQRRWENSLTQPNLGGNDFIIGQNGSTPGRGRQVDYPLKKWQHGNNRNKKGFCSTDRWRIFFRTNDKCDSKGSFELRNNIKFSSRLKFNFYNYLLIIQLYFLSLVLIKFNMPLNKTQHDFTGK